MFRAEDLFGPLYSQVFHHVHIFATAVVALARIPFRILVGHHTALGLQDRFRYIVFGSYEDDLFLLPPCLINYGLVNLNVKFLKLWHHPIPHIFSISLILSSLRWCLPPSNLASSHVLAISLANSLAVVLPPMTRTFASLCSFAILAVKVSHTRAALTLGNLLATIDIPIPVPQISIPFSNSPSE